MAMGFVNGARLAYVVVPLQGKVMREHSVMVEKTIGKLKDGSPRIMHEMKRVEKEEPAGFMVYFPRGHAIRVKTKEDLKHYNLDAKPSIINLEGLSDPNSPLGRMIFDQDKEARAGAYTDLQQQVIDLATKKTGKVLMPEQTAKKVA